MKINILNFVLLLCFWLTSCSDTENDDEPIYLHDITGHYVYDNDTDCFITILTYNPKTNNVQTYIFGGTNMGTPNKTNEFEHSGTGYIIEKDRIINIDKRGKGEPVITFKYSKNNIILIDVQQSHDKFDKYLNKKLPKISEELYYKVYYHY